MSQGNLFSGCSLQTIDLGDQSFLDMYPSWMCEDDACQVYEKIVSETEWQQPEIKVYGKRQVIPRLQAWYGNESAYMHYSGQTFKPSPWTELLSELKFCIESDINAKFNSVLVNFYRNGHDSVGWHADDEKELGVNPIIASLSFGVARTFSIKPKKNNTTQQKKRDLLLQNGDLVVMRGAMQSLWAHSIPKQPKVSDGRINLTFRWVQPSDKTYLVAK